MGNNFRHNFYVSCSSFEDVRVTTFEIRCQFKSLHPVVWPDFVGNIVCVSTNSDKLALYLKLKYIIKVVPPDEYYNWHRHE